MPEFSRRRRKRSSIASGSSRATPSRCGADPSGEALECAKSWVRFVEARNLYNEIKTAKGEESDEAHEALVAMKAAFRWGQVIPRS